MIRARAIERLADRQPGRRGFGGSADPEEAAAFRLTLRGDRDLNPAIDPRDAAEHGAEARRRCWCRWSTTRTACRCC